MNFAIIGCGRIAANHVNAAIRSGMNVVALCDLSQRAMDAIRYEFKLDQTKTYTDFKQMLKENQIDVVSLAVDSGIRAKIALSVLDFGVHLIVEKPMAMSLPDADAMLEKAEAKGVKICVCQQNRYNEAVQATRRALEQGRFGKLSHGTVQILWHRSHDYYAQAAWRGTWARDGGALMNQCIHGIDLLRWMMGDEIDCVYGATRRRFHPYIEAEDVGLAVVSFKNGAIATIEGTTNVFPKNLEESLCLFGEKGTVKIAGESTNEIAIWQFDEERPEDEKIRSLKEQTANVYGNGHLRIFADMKEAIEQDRKPYVDGACGRRALELVLAIYKSQKTGLPVQLPLTDFASTDMAGEFD